MFKTILLSLAKKLLEKEIRQLVIDQLLDYAEKKAKESKNPYDDHVVKFLRELLEDKEGK